MALALILALTQRPNAVAVSFDIGKNRFLRWQLGKEETVSSNGLTRLVDIVERSELIGPLRPEQRGRGEFLIPAALVTREAHWLQVFSYKEPDGSGPALSSVALIPVNQSDRLPLSIGSEDLPPPAGMTLSTASGDSYKSGPNMSNHSRETSMTGVPAVYAQQVDNVAFSLRERKLSQPLFLQALLGALPNLLPMLAPAIGSFISGVAPAVGQVAGNLIRSVGGGGGGTQAGTDAGAQTAVAQIGTLADQAIRALGPSVQQILTPENMRQIIQLIQAGRNAASAPAAPTATPTAPARTQALGYYSQAHFYSQAQVAPALLAALPALMPLLQQVLSPQTIQSIIGAPERLTGQVINGITDFARLGLQADQQLQQHLERLNPGVDDPALHQLLAGLSLGLSSRRTRNYKRVASVRMQIDDVQMQMVFGREIALYAQDSDLRFPLTIETPQAINAGEINLQVKQADSLRIVYETTEKVGAIHNGPLDLIPTIEKQIAQSLTPQSDYIVILTLLWQNSNGQWRGTSVQHTISLMSKYRFDRIDESGELIALDDRETFRDYWHQIWETDFDRETRRVDLSTRYYLTLDPQRNRNARMDSQVRTNNDGARASISIRSGYDYSLFALNHLLSRLTPEQSPLSEDILHALATDDFVERFNQAAQHQGQMRGRPGDRAALWVYPEFKIQTLVMVNAIQISEAGNVLELAEERIQFPMPVMMHFVGVVQES